MQNICVQLTGGSICLLYICIVLVLAVKVAVYKASMLNWWGIHLPSIYMYCTRSSSGCSSTQGIYDQLTGGHLPSIYIYIYYIYIYIYIYNIYIYIYIVLDLAIGVVVWKASMPDWLGGSIYFLYICIVLDLAVGVALCKAFVLNYLGVKI